MAVLCVTTIHGEEGKKNQVPRFIELGADSSLSEVDRQKCIDILNDWINSIFSSDNPGQVDVAQCTFELVDVD